MGEVISAALARAGIDTAGITRLCLADEAASALAASPDTPELQYADAGDATPVNADDTARADAFTPKILAMAKRLATAPPPDFAKASFAELFAWSLSDRAVVPPSTPRSEP